ncbi:Bug family tripartite tricarboxylate transporter substrate binding protein [Candidimonas nitroreducens]|nr:tripartite tricarboxylate transporter substrate binding protein [Candidimonas nitroreducens]
MTLSDMTLRKMARLGWVSGLALMAAGLHVTATAAAAAQAYPSHMIKFVVPFPPGGGTDTLARYAAQALEKELKQPVVVENKPGAGTVIGTSYVAHAPADGYTILVGSINTATNRYLYKKLPYDPAAIMPLGGLAYSPSIIVTSEKKRFHDVKDLVAYSKAHPGKLNFASYGIGSSPHLGTELLIQATGLDATHVPYQGGGPAQASVLAGQTDFLMSSILPVLSLIKSGRLAGLGVAADKRLDALPQVPTLKEQGIDLATGTWFGFFINSNTPAPIVHKLDTALSAVMARQGVLDFIAKEGAQAMPGGRKAFTQFVTNEEQRWQKVIQLGKISVD